MTVQLIAAPQPWMARYVWPWLLQHQAMNFDDAGPPSVEAFEVEMMGRVADGESLFGVVCEGQPCGLIGYRPINRRLGTFHGIVFDRTFHRTGVPQTAVRQVLDRQWAAGVEKVCATFFAENTRVHRFLTKLGAVNEGLLRAHTTRHGVPIDMRMVAFFSPESRG